MFALYFAKTSQTLHLAFEGFDSRVKQLDDITQDSFPALRHLELSTDAFSCNLFLNLLRQSPIQHLILLVHIEDPFTEASSFQTLVDTKFNHFAPTLRHLTWRIFATAPDEGPPEISWTPPACPADSALITKIVDRCSSLGVLLEPIVSFYDPIASIDYNTGERLWEVREGEKEAAFQAEAEAAQEVLSFTQVLVGRLEKTGGRKGIREILRMLGPLYERMQVENT